MEIMKEPSAPPPRSSGLMALLMLLALGGMAYGVFAWKNWADRQEPAPLDGNGLDVSKVEVEAPPDALPMPAPPPVGGPLVTRALSPAPGGPAPRPPFPSTRQPGGAAKVTAAVRKSEGRYEKLARQYSRKHPIIRQYGRDWMRHPDLKRFNDEYFQDHDPIKFAKNVAASPNFAALVQKYAQRQEMIAFAKDAAKIAPAELMTAIQDYLKTDSNAAKLVQRFATAIGLPPYLIAGLLGGEIDSKRATEEILKGNPQLQGLLNQPGQKRRQ